MNKIGRLSDATGLWAVFASYDPERKEHSAIICNPPHTKGPSRECCIQDVILEVSRWPGGVDESGDSWVSDSQPHQPIQHSRVYLQLEDDLEDDDLEGEDLYGATPLPPLLRSVQPQATNRDQTHSSITNMKALSQEQSHGIPPPSTAIPAQEASIRASITQLQPQLSKVEQAVELVLEMFGETLTVTELVAAVNIVRNEREALIFLIIRPAKVKEAWLFSEIRKFSAT